LINKTFLNPLFCNIQDFEYFFNKMNKKEFGICFDSAHAKLEENQKGNSMLNFLKKFKKKIIHLHISDAKGKNPDNDGLEIGKGEIDFKEILSILKGKNIMLLPEIINDHKNNYNGTKTAYVKLKKYL